MDNLREKINRALFIWRERRRMAIVHVICLVVYYYMIRIHPQSRIVDRTMILEKERAREKIMKRIASSEGRKIIRMGPIAFLDLCAMLEREGGLQSTQRVSIEEQVAKTLYILTHNVRNREVQLWFRRSGETTSRHFHRVLRSIVELEDKYLKQPDGLQIPIEIFGSNRFNTFFKDCVGAIDCTHVRVKVPLIEASKYRGRKDFPTQNVLVACSFDLRFTYVLPGWEGTASDSRILKDALRRTDNLRIPRGKYYLLDAGFMLRKGLITPYRSTRYHLKEFSSRNLPRTPQELFNHRHSSLRNAVERAFEVLKKRFPIIASGTEPTYEIKTQNRIIIACCILHNYLMMVDPDEELVAEVDEEISEQSVSEQHGDIHIDEDEDEEHTRLGEILRNSIADAMWRAYRP
ncbi:protein ANTAGONIST OF LIKE HETEROCHROMATIN PROTEIN 1-like [Gastrolobium bilobum]|uniref:protein ANTAGONIST OF LIKE HETEROCHROMATIN PROTEIN 1-like n=1 Tax=Gastrolobium bilobum TaxID=150636 RepID=UPI002AB1C8F3|nr:protein ANTAGONIST OF LIKE HETEROCHROMATIN PROTEIN 1-like [Gastrolobium bilobum]